MSFSPISDTLKKKQVSWDILNQFKICHVHDGIIDGVGSEVWAHKIPGWNRPVDRLVYPLYDHYGVYRGLAFRTPTLKFFYDTEDKVVPSSMLYGLHSNSSCIQRAEYAIIVEGMFDFLKLYDSGIKNVVTTLGTYLSWDQMCLLRRFCKCALICYDPDAAGVDAAIAASNKLRQGGILPVIVNLDFKIDPDEYVIKYGVQKFLEICFQSIKNTDTKLSIGRLTGTFFG